MERKRKGVGFGLDVIERHTLKRVNLFFENSVREGLMTLWTDAYR